jgi:hypothetical protein
MNFTINSIADSQYWWTSGCRLFTSWIWSNTGQLFSYDKWETGGTWNEPGVTDTRTQACLCLVRGTHHDCWCEEDHLFICEETPIVN